MNKEQDLFDNPRFIESLKKTSSMTLPDMIKTVEADVKIFTAEAPQSDDITMFTLRYQKK